MTAPPEARQPADVVKFAAALVAATIILVGLHVGRDILIPLAIAFLIGFALDPPVTWLVRLGLPRVLAILAVMATVVVMLSGLGMVLATQVRALATDLPTYQSTVLKKMSGLRETLSSPGMLDRALEAVGRVKTEVAESVAAAGSTTAPHERPQRVEVVTPAGQPVALAAAWLGRAVQPLAVAGIVFVFVFLVLLDRGDLRDRMLSLMGRDVHRATESLEEAGNRVSRYLLMQLLVNVSYGVPMSIGLWLIGVPGALLWGTVAAVMRFVPYVGPMISAVFPIALAFAVDDGWNMVLWTIALIVFLELVSNNIVEPLLYGSTTGLSAISLIGAALFWTAIWGPMGLILSTPITVCLLVLGRNVPQLGFLNVLLGATPVLALPTRIYQRLIADDAAEALDIVRGELATMPLQAFYSGPAADVLRLASADYLRSATAEHRLRFAEGMDLLLDELRADHPPAEELGQGGPRVVCLGGKWDIDAFAAAMLAHALALGGQPAEALPAATVDARYVAGLDLAGDEIVCICLLSAAPAMPARHLARRLRMRWPGLRIVVAAWNPTPEMLAEGGLAFLHADAVVTSIDEAIGRVRLLVDPASAAGLREADRPVDDAARVAALRASGLLDPARRPLLDSAAKRAADVFNADIAVISTIDDDVEHFVGQSGRLPAAILDDDGALLPMPRSAAICDHVVGSGQSLVVPDIERDPRFADNTAIRQWGVRFYAGTPLRADDDSILGALCILDAAPRVLDDTEIALLESLAAELSASVLDDRS